jgi:hypothetical protein
MKEHGQQKLRQGSNKSIQGSYSLQLQFLIPKAMNTQRLAILMKGRTRHACNVSEIVPSSQRIPAAKGGLVRIASSMENGASIHRK